MNCVQYSEWVAADVDGIAGVEADSARVHARECVSCRGLRDGQMAVRAALRDRSLEVQAPYGLRTRITAGVEEVARQEAGASAWGGFLRWGAVAVTLVGTMVALWPREPADPMIVAYDRVVEGKIPLAVETSDPGELEAYYGSQEHRGIASHVIDLEALGFHLLGGVVHEIGGRSVRLSVYTDGRSLVVCDLRKLADYSGHLPGSTEPVFFSRGGLSFCVRRMGEEICVLVGRMPLSAFRLRLLGRV